MHPADDGYQGHGNLWKAESPDVAVRLLSMTQGHMNLSMALVHCTIKTTQRQQLQHEQWYCLLQGRVSAVGPMASAFKSYLYVLPGYSTSSFQTLSRVQWQWLHKCTAPLAVCSTATSVLTSDTAWRQLAEWCRRQHGLVQLPPVCQKSSLPTYDLSTLPLCDQRMSQMRRSLVDIRSMALHDWLILTT